MRREDMLAGLLAQAVLLYAQRAQPLGARAFKELEVVGIKHNAAGIRVFPVNAQRPLECAGCPLSQGASPVGLRPLADAPLSWPLKSE